MDFLFPDKKVPQALSKQLRVLIETIGETRNKEQQDAIINKQIQNVKEQISLGIPQQSIPDTLVKLIYFQTMGYDTSFAHILPINLCQSTSIYIKKMSYLLAAMLTRPGKGAAVLMHNTIIKDLQSQNLYIIMIVLTMLRYFLTVDLITEIFTLVNQLRKHTVNMIRRKSYLVLLNIYQKHPEIIPDMKTIVNEALNDSDSQVMFAGVSIAGCLIKQDPIKYKDLTKKLSLILWNIVDHKYPAEYDYHKIPAPWMQIDILKMLEALGKNDQNTSSLIYDVLEKTLRRACSFPMNFNKAIIQQCIKTVSHIYPHTYLLQQSEESLEKFFESGNNNMKYFGIVALTQLTKSRKQAIDKWQILLLECMESIDLTLAEKTLELLVQIANEENTTIILNKIISLTQKSTDDVERRKLVGKALILIERFSENREIFLRRMNEIFYKFQNLISDRTVTNFLNVLVEISDMDHEFPAMALATYTEIMLHFRNPALVKVSAWVISEFTYLLYSRNKDTDQVDASVCALLEAADEYLDNRFITFIITTSLAKLSTITSKKDQVKSYWLKVCANKDYFTHTIAEQMIRMAKYSKALSKSSEVSVDKNMRFLNAYVEQKQISEKKEFLFSKVKLIQKPQKLSFFQKDEDNTKVEPFKFNPGSRWGAINGFESKNGKNRKSNEKPVEQIQQIEEKERKKSFNLRGPHQQKKTKNPVDEKKLKLAQSIFGNKKK